MRMQLKAELTAAAINASINGSMTQAHAINAWINGSMPHAHAINAWINCSMPHANAINARKKCKTLNLFTLLAWAVRDYRPDKCSFQLKTGANFPIDEIYFF